MRAFCVYLAGRPVKVNTKGTSVWALIKGKLTLHFAGVIKQAERIPFVSTDSAVEVSRSKPVTEQSCLSYEAAACCIEACSSLAFEAVNITTPSILEADYVEYSAKKPRKETRELYVPNQG